MSEHNILAEWWRYGQLTLAILWEVATDDPRDYEWLCYDYSSIDEFKVWASL